MMTIWIKNTGSGQVKLLKYHAPWNSEPAEHTQF